MTHTKSTLSADGQLPPNPTAMNEWRSTIAGLAIASFMAATGSDLEDALPDLLADLMHWSDRQGCDFDAMLERAKFHYEAETTEEANHA